MSSTLQLYQDDYHVLMHPEGAYATSLVEALKHIPAATQTVLDVGCSRGDFGYLVKQVYPHTQVIGLEFAPQAVELARQQLDHVIQTDIQAPLELPIEKASVDCITCLDVLEHLLDPAFTLTQLVPYLKPTGRLIVSLPNVRWQGVVQNLLLHGRWQDGGAVIQPPHLRYFTLFDIFDLLAGAGLKPITDVSCVASQLSPGMEPLIHFLVSQGLEPNMLQLELQTIQYVLGASTQGEKPDMSLCAAPNRVNWTLAEIRHLFQG